MKEVKIFISDEEYSRIKHMVTWINTRNLLRNNDKPTSHGVENFIKGSAITILEEFENINPMIPVSIRSETKFRNRFKEIAKEKGVRQIDIANTLDVEKSYISLIFNNKNQPGTELFFKIWAILGCPPIYKTIYFKD